MFIAGAATGSPQESLLATLLTLACLFGVRKFSRAESRIRAYRWFAHYPLRGAFVLLLTSLGAGLGLYHLGISSLIQLPLIFYWFWLFAAAGTYFRIGGEP
jgi:hypothetical protein